MSSIEPEATQQSTIDPIIAEIITNDVEIEHCGVVMTVGEMVQGIRTGRASYWHWHMLFSKTVRLYNSVKETVGYGILLPNELVIDGKTIGALKAEIANGTYDADRLLKLVRIHEFLAGLK